MKIKGARQGREYTGSPGMATGRQHGPDPDPGPAPAGRAVPGTDGSPAPEARLAGGTMEKGGQWADVLSASPQLSL